MTDSLLLVREHDPVASDDTPPASALARMDAALEAALHAPPAPAPARWRRRRWMATLAATGAATAAVLAVAGPGGAPHPASAATVLADLGRKAAASESGHGRYAYWRTRAYTSHVRTGPGGSGRSVAVIPTIQEQWVAADGTGMSATRMLEDRATFPTAADRRAWEQAGPHPAPAMVFARRDRTVSGLTPAQIAGLPTDPVALRERLAGVDLGPGALPVVAVASGLLETPLTPPAVRRALYDVLRGLPNARLRPAVADPLHRSGVGVEFSGANWTVLFVFDRGTGALLGTASIGHAEIPGRDIEDWTVVEASGWRDDAPAPAGSAPRQARPDSS